MTLENKRLHSLLRRAQVIKTRFERARYSDKARPNARGGTLTGELRELPVAISDLKERWPSGRIVIDLARERQRELRCNAAEWLGFQNHE